MNFHCGSSSLVDFPACLRTAETAAPSRIEPVRGSKNPTAIAQERSSKRHKRNGPAPLSGAVTLVLERLVGSFTTRYTVNQIDRAVIVDLAMT